MNAAILMRAILLLALIPGLNGCGGGAMIEEPASYGEANCETLAAVHDASQLGCATRHNIAALAENPGDLMRPRRETPRDAMRRDSVLNSYFQSRAKSAAPASLPAAQTNQASVQP